MKGKYFEVKKFSRNLYGRAWVTFQSVSQKWQRSKQLLTWFFRLSMLFTSGDKRLKGFGRILVSWSSFLVGEMAWFRWAMMRWQESIGWICAEGDESTASEKNGTRSDSTTISEKLLTSNIVKCLQRQNFLCCYHLKQNFQCVKWPQAKTNFQDVISSSAKLISI